MSPPAAGDHPRERSRRRWRGLSRLAALVAVSAAAIIVAETLSRGVEPGKALAERFASAWNHHDWPALYRDVDAQTRATVPYPEFAGDYARAYATATVTGARMLPGVRLVGGSEVVALRIRTRVFGTLRLQYTLPLTGNGSDTRIIWHQNLAFPGLYPGETIHRSTLAPQRGELLARDGVPLTQFSSAHDIIGSVGPASGGQLERLEAEGFPADTEAGQDGLEYLFQRQLAGRPGGELFAGPRPIARTNPLEGEDVKTSIDPELENDATSAFDATGMAGGIVLMVPKSGELLAVAGSPLSQTQPPGSTFKIVTATAVLESGIATVSSSFPYGTYAVIDGYKLHNSDREYCGGTLINAFAVSCNSVYAPLGVKLGAQRLVATAERYGKRGADIDAVCDEVRASQDLREAADVVAVFVGDDDAVEAVNARAQYFEPPERFTLAKAAIHQEAGILRLEQSNVARATRRQNGHSNADRVPPFDLQRNASSLKCAARSVQDEAMMAKRGAGVNIRSQELPRIRGGWKRTRALGGERS